MAFQFNDTGRIGEACPSRKGEQRHCWHHHGSTYTSYPSQHDETCCYCGRTDRIIDPTSGSIAPIRPTDHGPHFPVTTFKIFNSSSGGSSSSQPGEPAK